MPAQLGFLALRSRTFCPADLRANFDGQIESDQSNRGAGEVVDRAAPEPRCKLVVRILDKARFGPRGLRLSPLAVEPQTHYQDYFPAQPK